MVSWEKSCCTLSLLCQSECGVSETCSFQGMSVSLFI